MSGIKKAVITAAGMGTRMYPASRAVKKELFPLVDVDGIARPALSYIFRDLLEANIEEFCLIIRKEDESFFKTVFSSKLPALLKSKMSEDWFHKETQFLEKIESRVTYIHQDKPDGFGHAVYCARQWVKQEPFLLLLGDQVYRSTLPPSGGKIQSCSAQLMDAYQQTKSTIVGVKRTSGDLVYRYGTVGGIPDKQIQNLLKVQLLKEKPDIEFARKYLKIHGLGENRYLCFFGIYAFQPEIFNCLDYLIKHHMRERDEYQLTSAMELLLKQNPDFHAYEIQGEFYDLGNPLSYVNAINAYSKPHSG